MANGDEKFLPIRDRGPQKRYVRDYVDARFSIGELLHPGHVRRDHRSRFIPDPRCRSIGLVALWAFFIVAIVDAVVLGFQRHAQARGQVRRGPVEKVRWYAAMRALQLRLMRLPKPQVKRGAVPRVEPSQPEPFSGAARARG